MLFIFNLQYFLISVNDMIFYDDLQNFCKTYIATILGARFFVYLIDVLGVRPRAYT